MAVAIIGPKFYAWDRNGKPLAFGKVYTYQARTNNPKATYQSEDGIVENTNPVILNGEGYANIYLDGSYKVVVKDSDDNEIWTADPVTSAQAEEWVNCLAAEYVSTTVFRVNGSFTDKYEAGRRVRIDNNTAEYAYSTIIDSSFAAGQTSVTISDAVITTGIQGVCVSIVGNESTGNVSVENVTQLIASQFNPGQAVKVKGYYVAGDVGDLNYLIYSLQGYRDYLGDQAWNPDDAGDHLLSNGNVAILQRDSDHVSLLKLGFTNDAITDELWDKAKAYADYYKIAWGLSDIECTISSTRELPQYGLVGAGQITGDIVKVTRNREKFHQRGGRFVCSTFWVSGAQYIKTEWIWAQTKFLFDGNAPDYGVFWCSFGKHQGDHEVDLNKGQSLNECNFQFIRGGFHVYGSKDNYVGPGTPFDEFNLNAIEMIDTTGADITAEDGTTGWHVLNESRSNQHNTIRQWYAEGSANRSIRGRWHVLMAYVDSPANSPYALPATSHVLFNPDNSVRNQSDYFAAAPENLAKGGCWNILNASSKGEPLCMFSSGGATGNVVADATEPTGIGYKYGGASSLDFSSYRIKLSKPKTGRYTIFFWMHHVNGSQSIQVENDGSAQAHALSVYHDQGDGWRLYRISSAARSDGIDDELTIFHRSPDSEFYLGAVWATPTKTALLPWVYPEEMIEAVSTDGIVATIPEALPVGGIIKNLAVSGNPGSSSWRKQSSTEIVETPSEVPKLKSRFYPEVTAPANVATPIARISVSGFNSQGSGEIEVFIRNTQSSPDFIGGSGYFRAALALLKDGDGGVLNENIQTFGAAWIQKNGGTTPPTFQLTQVDGNTWDVEVVTPAGVGDSIVSSKVRLFDLGGDFTFDDLP
ncbi:hypothetical protein [Vibrio phage vB_ValP_FGH]|nr:hypothetical protein [Vibrio phage vB_ValP_FGH]